MELSELRHVVRLRTTDDREYLVRRALDGVIVNANELENRAEASSSTLVDHRIPYLVDPMLWRFQVPDWWHRQDGRVKRNFKRLATRYTAGTDVVMARGPLMNEVTTEADWRGIAKNVVRYQRERIPEASGALLRAMQGDIDPEPAAIVGAYLLAETESVDAINRCLLEASAEAAGDKVIGSVALPLARALEPRQLDKALDAVSSDLALGALVWIEGLTEERTVMGEGGEVILRVAEQLAGRGLMVWHAHGGFAALALRDRGITGIVHPLAWRDSGAPAPPPKGVPQHSRTSYLTAMHQSERFGTISQLAAHLTPEEYLEHYCSCWFCGRALAAGRSPLELMLEETERQGPRGRVVQVPSEEALSFNRWHFLWARHLEVEQLREQPVASVIGKAIDDARWLHHDAGYLHRLAAVSAA